jgi:hypothetical protein
MEIDMSSSFMSEVSVIKNPSCSMPIISLEQVTVNEVAVGCGCFWMNELATFHLSLTYYIILLLKLWMVSLL